MTDLFLREEFRVAWQGQDPFGQVRALDGDVFRSKEGRRTLRFFHAGRPYFLKYHQGVGWGEVIKNLLQGRAPVVSACNEYLASLALAEAGVDTLTPAAYGRRGHNPAAMESFLITDDLVGTVSLEDYCRGWPDQPPPVAQKRRLLNKVMWMAATMHGCGINHRDFYLCHFLLVPDTLEQGNSVTQIRCHLIDLHRAGLRRTVPLRWRIKDVAGLFYSAMDIGLTRRDLLRAMAIYSGVAWRETMINDHQFWSAVKVRAEKLYRKDMGREAPKWFVKE
ncbi:MAG: lipopolysaccharide core heptose(I) kinase RfaP [Alcanivorax sp.]|uniref:lipopolysaccharide core heptose(I) kinase RfaP n=1 Tax=unclassified Alcanivorax TaxID=2638842 RepID=UPI000789CAF0|nr:MULTISPECIES: lipopolysaccharide core heptose(I) kinase RfaP [unclassified Alcanivorax]MBB11198.1 lipopolysaccharide core heptose(I) kinase RfaP [Alcanivorax sp.]MBU85544.1 lipopolysaccharide core heptose(I) kinase RfaP [Alcanivorax sp.]MEE2603106.1 lipopolysaccharide core heptose(I) kinase RfaP [Pseudomonadota bacterium]